MGTTSTPMEECQIQHVEEIYVVEKNVKLSERSKALQEHITNGLATKSK